MLGKKVILFHTTTINPDFSAYAWKEDISAPTMRCISNFAANSFPKLRATIIWSGRNLGRKGWHDWRGSVMKLGGLLRYKWIRYRGIKTTSHTGLHLKKFKCPEKEFIMFVLFLADYECLNHFFSAHPDLPKFYVKSLKITLNGCF